MNPPFQDKRCESGSLLLSEILHFWVPNLALGTKISGEANFHFHACLPFEIMTTSIIQTHKGFDHEIKVRTKIFPNI